MCRRPCDVKYKLDLAYRRGETRVWNLTVYISCMFVKELENCYIISITVGELHGLVIIL